MAQPTAPTNKVAPRIRRQPTYNVGRPTTTLRSAVTGGAASPETCDLHTTGACLLRGSSLDARERVRQVPEDGDHAPTYTDMDICFVLCLLSWNGL